MEVGGNWQTGEGGSQLKRGMFQIPYFAGRNSDNKKPHRCSYRWGKDETTIMLILVKVGGDV